MSNQIDEEHLQKVINKSFNTLEDKINNIIKTNLNVQDIIYKQSPEMLKRGLEFNSTYQEKEFTEDDLKRVKLSFIIQSQYDDYYENASSKHTAEQFQKVLDGKLTSEDIREQDFYPLLVDEKTNIIIDGNHRHYALSKINSPYAVILYGESGESEQLTGEDIFDITTTGMPYYDGMIQKGHIAGNRDPVEYFKTNKNIVFKIEWMSPDEYLEKSFEIHKDIIKRYMSVGNRILIAENRSALQMTFEDYLRNTNKDNIKDYKERTLKGSKMPIPMLDYNSMSQEGRHRAIVAQQLGVEEIPVLVVRIYNEY